MSYIINIAVGVTTLSLLCVSLKVVVIHPFGPQMCEQLHRTLISILSTSHTSNPGQAPGHTVDIFHAHNLSCVLTDPETESDSTGHRSYLRANIPSNFEACAKITDEQPRKQLQMRRVMCTDASLKCEVVCQHVNAHIICTFISNKRSCVFTTKLMIRHQSQVNRGRYNGHCINGSSLTRDERQMRCLMVSRVLAEEAVHVNSNEIPEYNMSAPYTMSAGSNRDNVNLDDEEIIAVNNSAVLTYPYSGKGLHQQDWARRPNKPISRIRTVCSPLTLDMRMKTIKKWFLQGRESINCKIGAAPKSSTVIVHWAMLGNIEMFDFLLSLGAELPVKGKSKALDVFHAACMGGNMLIVERLEELDVDVKRCQVNDQHLLLIAASLGRVDVVRYLVDTGCDVTVTDSDGHTILYKACRSTSDNVSLVSFILGLNASRGMLDKRDKAGRSPAVGAAISNSLNVLKFLVQEGCDMKVVTNSGNTILHAAAFYGRLEVVKYVASLEVVRLDFKNKRRKTAYTLALGLSQKGQSHRDVADFLANL